MSDTPTTPLALLAHLLPQRGPGLLLREIEVAFYTRGIRIAPERLAGLLRYLVYNGMAVAVEQGEEPVRYRQATRAEWEEG